MKRPVKVCRQAAGPMLPTEINFKQSFPESPCKFIVNNDEKSVLIDCGKVYLSAIFGKGFGETIKKKKKKVFPGNWQVKTG